MRIFRNVFSLVDQKRWVLDHRPVQRMVCKSWQFEKDIRRERSFTGHVLPLCETCHQELYNPFTEELR